MFTRYVPIPQPIQALRWQPGLDIPGVVEIDATADGRGRYGFIQKDYYDWQGGLDMTGHEGDYLIGDGEGPRGFMKRQSFEDLFRPAAGA